MQQQRLFFLAAIFLLNVIQTYTMELPIPLSPAKIHENESVGIVTPRGIRVRAHLLHSVITAISGAEDEENIDPETMDPDLLHASPKSFCKMLRKDFEDQQDEQCARKGITREMVNKKIPYFQEVIAATQVIDEQYSPAPSPIKKEVQEVLNKFKGTENLDVRKANTGIMAYNRGSMLVYDPSELDTVAPSPERRKFIWAHEMRHKENDDLVRRLAFEKAFKDENKPLTSQTKNKIARVQETFADLEVASQSPNSGAAFLRIANSMVEAFGKGSPEEHPSYQHRAKVAQNLDDFHKIYAQERKRKEERAIAEPPKSRRRLIDTFEPSASEPEIKK